MTYHDKNRLVAHLGDLKLTATQLAVAKEIADQLSLKQGNTQRSGRYLGERIGRTEKTTQTAIRALLELGIFIATRGTSHRSRTFELAINCSPDCLHLEAHNSPIRLKRLAIRAKEAQKVSGNSYPQETQLSGNLDQLSGNSYLTNRDLKIDDIELELSKSIETISELLNDLGELNAKQLKLKTWIEKDTTGLQAQVRQIAQDNQVENLESYLRAIIKNNPDKLYRNLEQSIKTSKQALKEQKQTATIYKDLPGSDRLDESRLAKYCLDNFGLKITPVSSKLFMKRGAGISSKDIELAKYFEAIASHPNITQIDPNQRLELDLVDGEITASYLDIDGSSFNWELLTPQEIISWGILEASELELHLEAERQEKDLIKNYQEATGASYPKALFALQPELAEIRSKYPRISPQEARKRYTQGFSEFITAFYLGLPEQPIKPLDTWLKENYTKLDDYQDLLEHYPENTSPNPWNENAGLTTYLEAEQQGLTWDKLARAMDSYRENLGSTYPKAPNNWIKEQLDRYQQAKAKAKSGERAGEATSLKNILGAMARPNSN
jgi:biotin operon repressor